MQDAIWVAFTARGLVAWQLAVQGQSALKGALMDGTLDASDLSAGNPEGWTALHVAAQAGNKMHVRALLSLGAYVDVRNSADRTPAFIAAWQGHLEVMVELYAAGADLNAYDQYGCSIAHRARQGPTKIKRNQGVDQTGQIRREVAAKMGVTDAYRALSAWLAEQESVSFGLGCRHGCRYCDPQSCWPTHLVRAGPTIAGRGARRCNPGRDNRGSAHGRGHTSSRGEERARGRSGRGARGGSRRGRGRGSGRGGEKTRVVTAGEAGQIRVAVSR